MNHPPSAAELIYAPATARGRAGIAVIRLSGPGAGALVAALTGRDAPSPRRLLRRDLFDHKGEIIDEAMVVTFAAGASFTGEESAELHIHGGAAVMSAALARLGKLGARLAEPGEFARRAFEHGRMDLAEAEGLADLIDAETEAQRAQALRLMRGALSEKAARWRGACIEARALAEAAIDFADEDLPETLVSQARKTAQALATELRAEVVEARGAARLRDGFEVAILGRPNAGKSTLINQIAGRQVAIAAATPGTTRDALEARVDLDGLPVSFIDTAGLREAIDEIEAQGVEIARRRGAEADLRIILLEQAGAAPPLPPQPGDLVVANRSDAHPAPGAISARSGAGVAALLDEIAARLRAHVSETASASHARHIQAMTQAIAHLEHAQTEEAPELTAEQLRLAAGALGSLIGEVDLETVLDDIFGRFCLGK